MTELEVLGFSAMLMLAYQAVWDVSLLDDPESQLLKMMKEHTDHVVLSQGSARVGLEKVHMRGNKGGHRASVCQVPSPTPLAIAPGLQAQGDSEPDQPGACWLCQGFYKPCTRFPGPRTCDLHVWILMCLL